MKRHILAALAQWKIKANRKPLVMQGARQVGKTWAMKAFGASDFAQTAYVNFDHNPRMRALFSGDFDIQRLLLGLRIETGVDIQAGNTLLIFDEVQEVPQALSSLKYFYENAPEYFIVAAGSLLGVSLHHGSSFPVGKVDFLPIFPMDFRGDGAATVTGFVRNAGLATHCGDAVKICGFVASVLFYWRDARSGADFYRYAGFSGGTRGAGSFVARL